MSFHPSFSSEVSPLLSSSDHSALSSASSPPVPVPVPVPSAPLYPRSAGTQIRFNVIESIRNLRVSHISFCFSLLINIPQLSAIVYVLSNRNQQTLRKSVFINSGN